MRRQLFFELSYAHANRQIDKGKSINSFADIKKTLNVKVDYTGLKPTLCS